MHLLHTHPGRRSMKCHGARWQTRDIATIRTDEVRVGVVMGTCRTRQFESGHTVSQLRVDEETRLGERQQVTVNSSAIHPIIRKQLGEFRVADRMPYAREDLQESQTLRGDPKPFVGKDAPSFLLGETGISLRHARK